MWPNVKSPVDESSLWDAYNEFIWSDRSGIIELLLSIAELKTWCQLNNATLVLTINLIVFWITGVNSRLIVCLLYLFFKFNNIRF